MIVDAIRLMKSTPKTDLYIICVSYSDKAYPFNGYEEYMIGRYTKYIRPESYETQTFVNSYLEVEGEYAERFQQIIDKYGSVACSYVPMDVAFQVCDALHYRFKHLHQYDQDKNKEDFI